MSAPAVQPPTPDTPITIKVIYDDSTRRFKLQLRDLTAHSLPKKLNHLLGVPSDANVVYERYSDSAGCYLKLDSANVAAYKQLYRAAKAKLKLRIKATTVNRPLPMSPPLSQESPESSTEHDSPTRNSYLETVLSQPLPEAENETGAKADLASASNDSNDSNNDETKNSGNRPVQSPKTDAASQQPRYRDFSLDVPIVSHQSPTGMFCIDCNHCGRSIPNEHYHCSICENGDYDLCLQCVDSGVSCHGEEDHWLIKRVVHDGIVTNSTTETVAPLSIRSQEIKEETQPSELTAEPVPEKLSETLEVPQPVVAAEPVTRYDERICNACLKEFDETKMVTCTDCQDYDLCVTCLLHDIHGHHPGHAFSLIHDRQFCLKSLVMSRCSPGRHHHHAAICDGCEKRIIGVRHKCLTCPDWDYCSDCVSKASQTHSGHRFVPIYGSITEPPQQQEVHYGVFCDGPLCKNKPSPNYITGPRYKCAVCHDTDFCANCEAVPTNTHNHTHPLVKFKTPINNVAISTVNEDVPNGQTTTLGDRVQKSTSTQASAPPEVAQAPAKVSDEKVTEELEASKPIEQAISAPEVEETKAVDPVSAYQAFFVRDTVPDGTKMSANKVFRQTWTLFNPGPLAWPAGSDVRFVGGDSMFNVDTDRPSSLQSVASAMESNKLTAPVEPGNSTDFTVLLRSPSREGSAISYWRLKLSNGMPFGHRLWCDIQVQADASESEPESVKKEVPEHDQQPEKPASSENQQAESRMIFPTLDKESPEASAHKETAAAPRAVPSVPSVSNYTDQDYLTITETLSMGDDETADGFLTDEEYDVLDASDHEYLEAKQSQ